MEHVSASLKHVFVLAIAILVVIGTAYATGDKPILSTHHSFAAPIQASSFNWTVGVQQIETTAGQTSKVEVKIRNNSAISQTIEIGVSDPSTIPAGWIIQPRQERITVQPNTESDTIEIIITAPSSDPGGTNFTTLIRAANTDVPAETDYLTLSIQTPEPTATPTPKIINYAVKLSVDEDKQEGTPGENVRYELTIENLGDEQGEFDIIINESCHSDIDDCSETISLTSVSLDEGEVRDFNLYVRLPDDAEEGATATTVVRAQSRGNPNVKYDLILTTEVLGPTATPTEEPTDEPIATKTPTPGPICIDYYEEDDSRANARVIDVNVPQPKPDAMREEDYPDDRRSICPPGDEDWLKFGAIKDKIYTIDITDMAEGIDLSLELFDEDGNSLAFNDDFFDREEGDWDNIRPRIQSWQAPADGIYYIRIRDAAGRGGLNRTYTVVVNTESYGPTPVTVNELCLDIFEPDGLPEQASLIVSNERQEERHLCPTGDADWVKFFAKAGKRYFIYTDTGPYRRDDKVNDMQAGADTVMVLTGRDGVQMIDFNDDIPGGNTLDSQIEFNPEVDGFYFVQVKNIGDIGNQFIRYDLTLVLCKPGQTSCGRSYDPTLVSSSGTRPEPTPDFVSNPAPTDTPRPTPTVPAEEFVLDATNTPTPPKEPTATPASDAGERVDENSDDTPFYSTDLGFINEQFWRMWLYSDYPMAQQRVARDWVWGETPLAAATEPYRQAEEGQRLVQYFAKGRMELNNPTVADSPEPSRTGAIEPDDPEGVSFGLLVQDLVNSRIQVGKEDFLSHDQANIVVVGDQDDANAPTYATFQAVQTTPIPDMTGEYALDMLSDRDGNVTLYDGDIPDEDDVALTHYVSQTSHNIPAIFWAFLNQQGEVYANEGYRVGPLFDWERIVGYPMTEPYWVRVRINGEMQDVLVQIFQRRVLAYFPHNPIGQRVTMTDVGRHYYEWRYGIPLSPEP